jgi:nucleoside-diphosphate-sugar epimerase
MNNRAKKVVVTGGSGKAGRACVADLIAHGHQVFNVDNVIPTESVCPFIVADLADFGQTLDALSSVNTGVYGKSALNAFDAIVHLAAIPAPRRFTDPVTFSNNTLSTYNVFEASRRLGIKNIVWASSETVLGLPFETPPPYVPVDEDFLLAKSAPCRCGKLPENTGKALTLRRHSDCHVRVCFLRLQREIQRSVRLLATE